MQKLGITELTYIKVNQHRLAVAAGSLVSFSGDCIVNAANTGGLEGGGIDGALTEAGGEAFAKARKDMPIIEDDVRIPVGEARMTIGGDLKARWVVHAVGPSFEHRNDQEEDIKLISAYLSSLELASEHKCKTVAFSPISCGAYRGPRTLESVLKLGWDALLLWCQEDGVEMNPMEIFMVGFRPEEQELLLKCAQGSGGDIRATSGGCCRKKKNLRQSSIRGSGIQEPMSKKSVAKDQLSTESGIFSIPEVETREEKKKKKKKKKRDDGEDTARSNASLTRREKPMDDIDQEMADLASPTSPDITGRAKRSERKRRSKESAYSKMDDADGNRPSTATHEKKFRKGKSSKSVETQGDDAKPKGEGNSKGKAKGGKGSGRSKGEKGEGKPKGEEKPKERGERASRDKGGEGKSKDKGGKGKGKGKKDKDKEETGSPSSAA
eukprot:GEMP01031952.1.p1 GENE.GEMP01031952.1~~GEMP01031952.1.p1  ORF type:complete len:438 (+),score=108.80 GEMP01031952.1:134-1447(+)